MNFLLYLGNLFYFDWLKSTYMVTCNESIWHCSWPNGTKLKETRTKSFFFHLSNFEMLQNSVGISDFYMLHVAARQLNVVLNNLQLYLWYASLKILIRHKEQTVDQAISKYCTRQIISIVSLRNWNQYQLIANVVSLLLQFKLCGWPVKGLTS